LCAMSVISKNLSFSLSKPQALQETYCMVCGAKKMFL
jgi:hypothetical protein